MSYVAFKFVVVLKISFCILGTSMIKAVNTSFYKSEIDVIISDDNFILVHFETVLLL